MADPSTEETILSQIPDIGDDNAFTTDNDEPLLGPEGGDENPLQETRQDTGGDERNQPSGESTSEQHDDDSGGDPNDTWFNTDSKGNFVDSKGRVAIAAGHARRVFENLRREHRDALNQLRDSQTTVDELRRTAEDVRVSEGTLGGVPAQLGMSEKDVRDALKFYNGLKISPAETVSELVKIAREGGHNVDGIGQATDVNAIRSVVTEVLNPVLSAFKVNEEQQARLSKAEEQLKDFRSSYPDARIHEDAIAQLMTNDKSLTMERAYYELKLYAQRKGLDWGKSLFEQGKQNSNGGNQTTSDPSLVSGHSVGSAGNSVIEDKNQADEFADPDEDYRSIVRRVARQQGLMTN